MVAKSWRDSADKVPQHKYDIQIVDHYLPAIKSALIALLDSANIDGAINAAAGTIIKVKRKGIDKADTAAKARAMIAANSNLDTAGLQAAVESLYGDAWIAAGNAALIQLGAGATPPQNAVGSLTVDTAWSTWKPGNPAAALKVADGGLRNILSQSNIIVRGIQDSALDAIGNKIADGLDLGLGADQIARSIRDAVGSTSRAEVIAQTEAARAMTLSTVETYRANGIAQYDILISDGACSECVAIADAGPYLMSDDDGQVPIHPLCRCAVTPVVPSF